jgi:hypothetical protein
MIVKTLVGQMFTDSTLRERETKGTSERVIRKHKEPELHLQEIILLGRVLVTDVSHNFKNRMTIKIVTHISYDYIALFVT